MTSSKKKINGNILLKVTGILLIIMIILILISIIIDKLIEFAKMQKEIKGNSNIQISNIIKTAKALAFYFSFIISVALIYFSMTYPYKRKKLKKLSEEYNRNDELTKQNKNILETLEEEIQTKIQEINKDIEVVENNIKDILSSSILIKPNELFLNNLKSINENKKLQKNINENLSKNLTEIIFNENINEYIKLKFNNKSLSIEHIEMLKDSYIKLESFLLFIRSIKGDNISRIDNSSIEETINKLEETLDKLDRLLKSIKEEQNE